MSKRSDRSDSSGRFGARYGVRVRRRIAQIEEEQRKDHDCPECGATKVERESTGIWTCRRCDHTFAGGAYKPATKLMKLETVLETAPDDVLDEIEEED